MKFKLEVTEVTITTTGVVVNFRICDSAPLYHDFRVYLPRGTCPPAPGAVVEVTL